MLSGCKYCWRHLADQVRHPIHRNIPNVHATLYAPRLALPRVRPTMSTSENRRTYNATRVRDSWLSEECRDERRYEQRQDKEE